MIQSASPNASLRALADVSPEVSELTPLVPMNGGGLGTPLLEALQVQLTDFPELVIVLDDLHHLSNAVLVADLGRFVDLLPSQVHLVISTRMDPPLALTHHRIRRDLTEFRQVDLALERGGIGAVARAHCRPDAAGGQRVAFWSTAPKAGPRGCSWPASRSGSIPMRRRLSLSSAGTTG